MPEVCVWVGCEVWVADVCVGSEAWVGCEEWPVSAPCAVWPVVVVPAVDAPAALVAGDDGRAVPGPPFSLRDGLVEADCGAPVVVSSGAVSPGEAATEGAIPGST